MIRATVKVDLRGLEQYQSKINTDLRSGGQITGGSPISNALKQWAVRYRSFIQERFVAFSRGGGNWPPLKPATIRRRRGSRKKGVNKVVAILRDTGTLFNALSPEWTDKPGAIQQSIPFGVRVGFGGPGMYTKKHRGKATIADIANFHQTGAGHLPVRKIIVEPSEQVLNAMAADMNRALVKMSEGK